MDQQFHLRDIVTVFIAISCFAINRVIADGFNPMIQPTAGSVVPVGSPYLIEWSSGTSGPVYITLHTNTNAINITNSTNNTGSYLWTPDPTLAIQNGGRDYFLEICDRVTQDCTYTFDGRFSFTNATLSSTTSSSSASSSSPTSSSTTSNSPPTSTTPPSTKHKLSTNTRTAIGVTVSILGTATVLIGSYVIYRRRAISRVSTMEIYHKPELHADSIDGKKGRFRSLIRMELPSASGSKSNGLHELPGVVPVHELGTGDLGTRLSVAR